MSSTPINNGDSGLTARNAINANFLDHDNSLANLSTAKQDTIVSGTNIKTINGTSVLGSGDIVISGSGLTQQQVMRIAL